MLEALTEAVDGLQLPTDLDVLADVIALHDRLGAHIAQLAGEVDAAKAYELDGEGTLAGWLKAHARMSNRDAHRVASTAKRMRAHPVTAASWRDGGLSSGQVDIIESYVRPYAVGLFAEHEVGLVPDLEPLSMISTIVAMEEWAKKAEAVLPQKEPRDDSGTVSLSRLPGGEGLLRGNLDPECRALTTTALRLAMAKDIEGEPPRTWGEKRHDAFGDIMKFYVDNHAGGDGGSHRPHVNVVVTHDDLVNGAGGWVSDGAPIDGVTLSAWLCDCNVHRVLVDATTARIDYGRETKTIGPATRSALIIRDKGCRFPDCDRPATFCDGHHVRWWSQGGETNVDNLVLLCRRHHRTLHKPGWQAKLLPDAVLEITDPIGRVRTSGPPGFVGRE